MKLSGRGEAVVVNLVLPSDTLYCASISDLSVAFPFEISQVCCSNCSKSAFVM